MARSLEESLKRHMSRQVKKLLVRIEELEKWRESVEEDSTSVIGFQLDHEYEDAETPETWVDKKGKR